MSMTTFALGSLVSAVGGRSLLMAWTKTRALASFADANSTSHAAPPRWSNAVRNSSRNGRLTTRGETSSSNGEFLGRALGCGVGIRLCMAHYDTFRLLAEIYILRVRVTLLIHRFFFLLTYG